MGKTKPRIVVATTRPWNVENFLIFEETFCEEYDVFLITRKAMLTFDVLQDYKPDFVFFPHWSWIIPEYIYDYL